MNRLGAAEEKTHAAGMKPGAISVVAKVTLASVCGLAFGFTISVLLLSTVSTSIAGKRDFVSYWANGLLLVRHMSPYNGITLGQVERAAGYPSNLGVTFMLSPPWTLLILYPLGYFGLQAASILWATLEVACFAFSVHMLWIMHGHPRSNRHYLGYSFAPALICLIMGQITIFSLLGLVLFLRAHSSRPFQAGIAFWLCMLKPHLFVVIGTVLLVWLVVSKSYKVLAGAAVAVTISCLATYWVDPTAWAQYSVMMRDSGINREAIPCISIVLRQWLSPKTIGLQYVPMVLGCGWGLGYFWQRRHTWDWVEDGSLVALVSVLVAPYSWITDQALVIPAILEGAIFTRSQVLLVILAIASIVIEAELLSGVMLASNLYLWTAPAWFLWFVLARFASIELGNESLYSR